MKIQLSEKEVKEVLVSYVLKKIGNKMIVEKPDAIVEGFSDEYTEFPDSFEFELTEKIPTLPKSAPSAKDLGME